MPDADIEAEHQAPYDGEYVGTIEVVVLRCYPSDAVAPPTARSSSNSSKKSKKKKLSTSEHESDSEDIGHMFDGASDAKPKQKMKPKLLAFGLDGSYDPGSPKDTNWDSWGAPSSPVEKTKSDPRDAAWDNWDAPTSPVEKSNPGSKDAAWDNWDNPPPAKEKANSTARNAWKIPLVINDELKSAKSTARDAGDNTEQAKEESKTGSSSAWDNPSFPKDKPKTGKVEMLNENEGTMHSSNPTKSLNKSKRWSTRAESCDLFRSDWKTGGSERGRSREPRAEMTHQDSTPIKIRGGGLGSYTVGSPGAGRTSPTVVINIAAGPPPPKDWMAEAKAEREGKKEGSYKAPTLPPANDPWTMNIPVEDYSNEAANHAASNWDWGAANNDEKKEESASQMPGGRGGSNEQTQGNDDWGASNDQDKADENWGNTGDDDSQKTDKWGNKNNNNNNNNKDEGWKNNGGGEDGHAPNDETKKNDDDWGNDDNDNQPNDKWDNDRNDTKQDDNWDAGNGSKNQKDEDWGKDKNQQYESWDNDNYNNKKNHDRGDYKNDEADTTWDVAEPEKGKEKENRKPAFSFGNSKAKTHKGSKKDKKGSQNVPQENTKSVKHNDQGPNSGHAKSPSKKASSATLTPEKTTKPGAWSPKPGAATAKTSLPGAWSQEVGSKKPKKGSPEAAGPTAMQSPPSFSLSSPPQPKSYWSTWKGGDKVEEPVEEGKSAVLEQLDSPLYSVPSEVAKRNNTSHQVRPGKPAAYAHKTSTPKYMDTSGDPYAVFVFQYRDKEIIEAMLKPTIEEPEDLEKQRLASLSKDELVEELMKMKEKEKLGSEGSGSKKSHESDKATFKSNPNGVEQGADWNKLSKKLKKFECSKVTTPEAVSGWLDKTEGERKNGDGDANGNGGKVGESNDIDDGNNDPWKINGNGNKYKKKNSDPWKTNGNGNKGKKKTDSKWDKNAGGGGSNGAKNDDGNDNKDGVEEKKDGNGWNVGGGDIWGDIGENENWDNDNKGDDKKGDEKRGDDKKDDDKKTSGKGNGGGDNSWIGGWW